MLLTEEACKVWRGHYINYQIEIRKETTKVQEINCDKRERKNGAAGVRWQANGAKAWDDTRQGDASEKRHRPHPAGQTGIVAGVPGWRKSH